MKTYRAYLTITRESGFARGFDGKWIHTGYDFAKARTMFQVRPWLESIDFCQRFHNDCRTRYKPEPNTGIYIKASGGKWGKSARLVLGVNVKGTAAA